MKRRWFYISIFVVVVVCCAISVAASLRADHLLQEIKKINSLRKP